jgi:ribosomal protein L2
MALKTFNPNTPGRRQLVIVDRSGLWKGKPVKTLTEGLTKSGGRNNHGRIRPRTAAVAVTSGPTVWSISSVARGFGYG